MPINKMEDPKYCTVYLRRIPKALKQRFKVWCMKQDISMTQAIIRLMEEKANAKRSGSAN